MNAISCQFFLLFLLDVFFSIVFASSVVALEVNMLFPKVINYKVSASCIQAERVGAVCVRYTGGIPGQMFALGTTIFVKLCSCAIWFCMQAMVAPLVPLYASC